MAEKIITTEYSEEMQRSYMNYSMSVITARAIPDARETFSDISFEDLDGDGESDVRIRFAHENGDKTELAWTWDPAGQYVFREDLSDAAISAGNLEDYVGLWE